MLKNNVEYRKKNYEKRIEIERKSRLKNKDRYRPARNARQSIRNRKLNNEEFVILPKELERIYNSPCLVCGSDTNQSLDHVIPLSRGGRHSVGNIITLCLSCNVSKHARTLTEWKLSRKKIGVG
jgi:5-methylcytosine-specific restriction endonuclease McrA